MRRRTALGAIATGTLGVTAGCLESSLRHTLEREDAWRELVVDPPDGIYVPPKSDEMMQYGTVTADSREIQLLAMRPHSFWTISGQERNRADVRADHALHLMVTVCDAETGVPVPATVTTAIHADEDRVDERTLWPMLSQRMGFHYGDNVALEGDGQYDVTVRIGPADCRTTGSVADRLEEPTAATVELEYRSAAIDVLERTLFDADEGRGERGALEPMEHQSPPVAPSLESLPCEPLGVARTADLVVPVVVVDALESDSDNSVLAVIPQTAYNGYLLPFASVSIAGHRDDGSRFEESLQETISPELGHHYGATLESGTEIGDERELTVTLESPPQLSRHEGYETAFLERKQLPLDAE